MAAGDLITRAAQYEYNGFLFGSGTKFVVERVEGLFELPNIDDHDIKREDRHGMVPGEDSMQDRLITLRCNLDLLPSEVDTVMQQLSKAIRPMKIELPFVYRRTGQPDKVFYCRPRKRAIDSNYELAHGGGVCDIQFSGSDPFVYAKTPTVVPGTIAAGSSSTTITVNSAGDEPTAGIFTIVGPALNPRLTVSGQTAMVDGEVYNGKVIAIDVNLSSGQILVVDAKNKIVTVNGARVYNVVRADNQWWRYLPGNNTVSYSRTGTTGTSTISSSHQNAWLS